MKERKYHLEELDTQPEILAEFQRLRDEAVADSKTTAKDIVGLKKRVRRLEKQSK